MKRFIIGHNADPSNWRHRLDRLSPRCLELFIPPKYSEEDGLLELRRQLEQMARHPAARKLEFASCHFPWGESVNGHSRYNPVDDQYFFPFSEIARAFGEFCSETGLPPQRSALNFHNLYELPRSMLEGLRTKGNLGALREVLLAHAHDQTRAAKEILAILELPLTLVNENNPPIGDGDRMSIVDVFAEDLAARTSDLHVRACMDLSHFFMTKFYYDLAVEDRPSFPYLEEQTREGGTCRNTLSFEDHLDKLRPLYFHVSDTKAPGTRREFEGLPIGSGDTPWIDVLAAMGRYASQNDTELFLIVELKGGHTKEGMEFCSSSERELRGFIEDCFASGFLDAISDKETVQ